MKTFSNSQFYSQFYLSQGYTGKKFPTNDCGPTCVAMVINILMARYKMTNERITKKDVIQRMPLFGRLPGWIPLIGGATAPWGMKAAFNLLADEKNIAWQASRISSASWRQIVNHLKNGEILSILRFWERGGAHWTNIVALAADGRRLLLLDPDPSFEKMADTKKIIVTDFSAIQVDWQRSPWWAACLGLTREIIVYGEKSQPE